MNLKLVFAILIFGCLFAACSKDEVILSRQFNGEYSGENLNKVAFPLGGMGAGMICLEGTGAISHVSVRNIPDVKNTPFLTAAVSVKGIANGTKVLEGPVPDWKIGDQRNWGNGAKFTNFGLPHFNKASFKARFPFGEVNLSDDDIPMDVNITGWSPFVPTDANSSSMPLVGLEYTFINTSNNDLEAAFSYHAENLMRMELPSIWGGTYDEGSSISGISNGFLLSQNCFPDKPHYKGDFAIFTDDAETVVDLCWFRGGWFDARTIFWNDLSNFTFEPDTVTENSPGASLYVPFSLKPGESKTVKLKMAWYVPHSEVRSGLPPVEQTSQSAKDCKPGSDCCPDLNDTYYEPWYSGQFKNIEELVRYWTVHYDDLREKSDLFQETFYSSSLPAEVLEAVTANLTILKSPTVLRQKDGRLWGWEGCFDKQGCCPGSCTHVWNYAQSIPHLFPDMERSLRETEFFNSQNALGHQNFRSTLPIKEPSHSWYAASDGQLGGIMKAYREWRISGDVNWMKKLYPAVKQSLDYCIHEWDPKKKGILEEPHHNTYDIEFWGPDGMCNSFYLGALLAITEMGEAIGEDVSSYKGLLEKGKRFYEEELFNGEYFIQKIQYTGLEADDPVTASQHSMGGQYSDEALKLLQKEGPKYQYGKGCLSDGVLGCWIAQMAGLPAFIDEEKIKSHLNSVYKYNYRADLSDHINPQRPSYAFGDDAGLLLCSWPKGGKLTLPFVYSNEVWTGIEYQVASHLMFMGELDKALDIVRAVRTRYDGTKRNPFNEYECGHWYARAMSSYGLMEGLAGIRYDAVSRKLSIKPRIEGDFQSFISTNTGWGLAGVKNGEPFIDVKFGSIDVKEFDY